MFDSISPLAHPTVTLRRSRLASSALWAVQILLAGMFLLAGGSKLAGAAPMVALFDAIGVGQWFRFVTGSVEVVSAIALLIPSLAPFGAVALVATMTGAVATHLFIVGGSPAMPLLLLAASIAVAWARRDRLVQALSRLR
jgi:uncharacterized membrane protein YphA (DoxX/SURF4 family)